MAVEETRCLDIPGARRSSLQLYLCGVISITGTGFICFGLAHLQAR